jgi:hypothetical protein
MTTTAADVTAAVRDLFPRPVRLSTRAAGSGRFAVRLPGTPARSLNCAWGEGFLGRRLGGPVTIVDTREIRRRDCGRDLELTLEVGA